MAGIHYSGRFYKLESGIEIPRALAAPRPRPPPSLFPFVLSLSPSLCVRVRAFSNSNFTTTSSATSYFPPFYSPAHLVSLLVQKFWKCTKFEQALFKTYNNSNPRDQICSTTQATHRSYWFLRLAIETISY